LPDLQFVGVGVAARAVDRCAVVRELNRALGDRVPALVVKDDPISAQAIFPISNFALKKNRGEPRWVPSAAWAGSGFATRL
jgi:hypothetical protein